MNFSIVFLIMLIGSAGLSYDIEVDEVEEVGYLPKQTVNYSIPFIPFEPETQTVYPEHWTCFDFAVNYSELHPEWGMVVISDNSRFQGMNHIVNYKINDDKSLQIISYIKQEEGWEVTEYTAGSWEYDTDTFDYYHFYINGEIPTRCYSYLLPNAEVVYNNIIEVINE